jgi:hypothetical protein
MDVVLCDSVCTCALICAGRMKAVVTVETVIETFEGECTE